MTLISLALLSSAQAQESAPPALFPGELPISVERTPAGLASLSAQACNACHWQAHDAWAGSAHARAWRSPTYQLAIQRAGDSTVCTACHLPLASQHAQLATSYIDRDLTRPLLQDNPSWDPTLMAEGIGCAACHVRDGVVLGVHDSPGAPHPVVVSPALSDPALCATCHQLTWPEADRPFYDTYGEWERSPYAQAGIRCQDCHMPPEVGMVTATKFAGAASHSFTADTARAVSVLITMDSPMLQRGAEQRVQLRLQNTGAGHHFPTGSPFKRYHLSAQLIGADGEALTEPFGYDLVREIEEAPPWATLSDTRLPAGGEVELEWIMLIDQRKSAQNAIIRVTVQSLGTDVAATILQEIPVQVL